MSTPRHEPRQHARPGRDPGRDGAVVRQRLRAVAGSGRPALAWHPATAALPRVDPPGVTPTRGERWSWEQPEAVDGPAPDVVPSWHRRPGAPSDPGSPRADGWLPSRPEPEERAPSLPSEVPEADEAAGLAARGGTTWSDDEAPGTVGDAEVEGEVDRLRRRAAQTAASAYTAAHGHPTAHSGFGDLAEEGGRRWAIRPRTAVVTLVVVLLLAAGVVVLRAPAGSVEPVARVGAAASPATAASGDGVAADADASPGAAGAPAADGGEAQPAPGPGGAAAAPGGVVVHVVGQVAAPGLVTVATDARVADALDAAGGATSDADLAALNLARAVTDGEQIHVPRPGEAVAAPPPAAPGAASAGTGGAGGAVVDLNVADAAALDTLPGIGPVLAERIVAWRDENGPFTAVDELGEVSGIGPAVLEDVRDLVRV
ncbi:ComEA family DNA-binding protein [Cellulosimicrobium cellulans]|uniref:ComEA family DNA-binding protein n=1 Tax=Cellulosimicrobium cellulans TaxID=1710 RepID=UPI00214A6138|nr:ComEA family DNA-binding protein [Cellulosimicrobium cellulans]